MAKRALDGGILVGLFFAAWAPLLWIDAVAHGLVLTSVRSQRPAPNQTVQCVIRNETQRDIYVVPEWIECENDGTVASAPGRELRPGESLNLSTSDGRACRCRATTDGQTSFGLFVSTSYPPQTRRGQQP